MPNRGLNWDTVLRLLARLDDPEINPKLYGALMSAALHLTIDFEIFEPFGDILAAVAHSRLCAVLLLPSLPAG
jgi:hypothetical protein